MNHSLSFEDLMSAPWKHFESIDSTNTFLLRYNNDDIANGMICTADFQTTGLGRNNRTWISPKGGLYFSALFLLENNIKYRHLLSFVAAFSAAEAIESLFPNVEVLLKWPNDLLINQQKVGGILLQGISGQQARIVIGIGINVYNDLSKLPNRLIFPVTTLERESDYRPSVMELAAACREHLFRRYLAWQSAPLMILEKYLERSATFGKNISFYTDDHTSIQGIDLGVGSYGEIVIQTSDAVLSYLSGEIRSIG